MSVPEIRGNVITDVENISGKVIGVRGKQGYSAYELAVQDGGYTGTEEEWFESLKGSPGTPGQDGDDGFSPTVSISDITGGHRVTITDGTGDHTFDVFDGTVDISGNGVAITVDSSGIMHFDEEGN